MASDVSVKTKAVNCVRIGLVVLLCVLNSSLNANQDGIQHSSGRRLSLQARKQELVRNAIWDAAIDLFAQKGFDETTVDDIVEAAGVSRRSFFRYFSSKSDLMTQRGAVSYEEIVTKAVQSCPATHSVSQILRHTVLQVAQNAAAEPRTRKILEIATNYPSARQALSHVAEVEHSVAKVFAQHCKKSLKQEWSADLLAGLTLRVTGAIVQAWADKPEQNISIIVDQVFAMLGRWVCEDENPYGGEHNGFVAATRKPKRGAN